MLDHITLYHVFIILIFIVLNIFTIVMFHLDKTRAIKNKSRISEKTLLVSTFIGGGLGAFFGMTRFRHKTQKVKFKIGVPIGAMVSLFILVYFLFL